MASARIAGAQLGVAVGVGGGIAGSTDQSLSNGQSGVVFMGQVTTSLLPVVKIGAEVARLQHTGANATFGTAIAELGLPLIPFFFKAGVGYGRVETTDVGRASGVALQIGAGYRLGIPLIPLGVAVVGNAYLAHSSSRSAQMVDVGLALRF